MDELLPPQVGKLQSKAAEVAAEWIAPRAEEVDRDCLWPEHSMKALAQAGFMGLHVPRPVNVGVEILTTAPELRPYATVNLTVPEFLP